MAKKFWDAVKEAAGPAPDQLPLVHTTSVPVFEADIADTGTLKPQACPVYKGQDLAYFFYGKPSYRPKDGENQYRHMLQHAPVCLVLDVPPGLVPRRILPFDSGAYENGVMAREGHAHRALKKERFELADLDAARATVGLFFGSNLKYFDEQRLEPLPIDQRSNTCVESYVSLISRTGTNQGDSRLTSIEIQYDEDITLAGAVRAVAMAEPFYDHRPEIQDLLRVWKAEPLLYPLDGAYTPNECCATINRMVRSYLQKSGYF